MTQRLRSHLTYESGRNLDSAMREKQEPAGLVGATGSRGPLGGSAYGATTSRATTYNKMVPKEDK